MKVCHRLVVGPGFLHLCLGVVCLVLGSFQLLEYIIQFHPRVTGL